ncbi:hypothetical protein Vpro01_02012 [Vibrio proteolyticus]
MAGDFSLQRIDDGIALIVGEVAPLNDFFHGSVAAKADAPLIFTSSDTR